MSKTIKYVLDKLAVAAMFLGQNSVDQALLEIQEIIKECKPDFTFKQGTAEYYIEINTVDEYQSNLEKRLK